ncbi:hypothetical protein [Roseateles sp.]|uniref:hypothetical protein n=1 Tax=Roseateles sp. TaxID=1971397 RepID=UPI003BA8F37C
MNTAANTFVIALVAVAACAAIGVSLANRTAAPAPEIVKLERVVVVGKRADAAVIAKLPRVVIGGRSAARSDVTVASTSMAVPLI